MSKPESFGQYVTMKRQQHGWSARQLAKRLGVAPTTITRLENGSVPHPEHFIALIDALHLDLITAVHLIAPYKRLYDRIVAAQEGRDRHG